MTLIKEVFSQYGEDIGTEVSITFNHIQKRMKSARKRAEKIETLLVDVQMGVGKDAAWLYSLLEQITEDIDWMLCRARDVRSQVQHLITQTSSAKAASARRAEHYADFESIKEEEDE